ncbi:pectate lyase family protein [Indioceanicola profundi]|uniref:pectate lyase family protein n=1 Tax=Indioceanicola profundi TaxID=2220096 RepID=UPI001CECB560|nr:hypothetical protein [Indioceanicola profundi]
MKKSLLAALCLTVAAFAGTSLPQPAAAADPLAFPGAQGWAAETKGGRGGRIIKVTTLAATGPGSFAEAVATKGPRIVVFEVGGVIDLERTALKITEPFLTIAGQTAPSPGITFIRGGLDIVTHDVIVQHIRVRPGEAEQPKMGGMDFDAIATLGGAYNVIVDHCSLTWATDENLSASGPRVQGDTPEEWRRNTSHRITFSNNIIAEGLAYSSHAKGEHSKGSLIHDNVSDILIIGNLYSNNMERTPLFKGGVRGAIVNNLIYNPGQKAIHYNLIAQEWGDHPFQLGQMSVVGNVMRAGPDTWDGLPLVMVGGSGDVELHMADNLTMDRLGRPLPEFGLYTTAPIKVSRLDSPPVWPEGLKALPAEAVQDAVIKNAGARPWERDPVDARIVADVIEGRGAIIDSEKEVGGYPVVKETRAPFDPAAWNLDDMTPRK